jgi:Zn-dependent M28 family amino/carboxypeptidase
MKKYALFLLGGVLDGVLGAVLGGLAVFGEAPVDFQAEGKLWWAHIQFLADDKLAGRNTGSAGYQKAADYVAAAFERFGLKPMGTSGYRQPVQFETRQLVEEESSLALVRDGNAEVLARQDAARSARGDPAPALAAPMVFVGYGLQVPEAHYDELAGLDLRGKIAVYVNGTGPVETSGNIKSHYASAVERWNALKRAGAVGIATIQNPRVPPPPDAGRGPAQPTFVLADPNMQEAAGMAVSVTITRRGIDKFLNGTGHTADEILKAAAANEALPKFPLVGALRTKAAIRRDRVTAPNVIGMLPGWDARLKDEYVIMSAHLDHVGIGRPVNEDTIYNGAMDDASGIASVLEIARIVKQSGDKLKRSLIFLAVTAEEKGELGSRYFAAHPTVPANQIVADINLDMFLPLHALQVIEVQGLAESTLGETIRAAAKEAGVAVQADKEPEQNRFIRSDQYSFIRHGVPALAFKFGYELGSPEEKLHKDWLKDRYHKPSDDLNQPVDKTAAAQFDRIILSLLERVANAPERPRWNSDSFFKRFAK